MLSLASMLNPSPPGAPPGSHLYSPPGSSSPEYHFIGGPSVPVRQPLAEKHRTAKDIPGLSKSKVKGTVKFCPFEDLDEASLREIRRFRVTPFGGIRNNCRHIPYNSGKKDFFEKTGRESFEVFQYTFKLPSDEVEYTVMWDYNVGLVRMTPFFKCCNYPKTTPAKMLNMNPGLRDITHSITGGSIMAQGYWMPFSCAKAVCATFCHHIAGALIPIFGPQFPSQCVHPDAPDHGRMCIDPAVVAEATLEAEGFRRLYAEQASMATPISPRQQQHRRHNDYQERPHRPYNSGSPYHPRPRFRGGHLPDSPYGTDTEEYDGEYHRFNHQNRYPYTPAPTLRAVQTAPAPTSGWTAANHEHHHSRYQPSERHMFHGTAQSKDRDQQQQYDNANPFLSAIPRLAEHTPQSSPCEPKHYLPAIQPRHCNNTQRRVAAAQFIASAAAPPTPVMSPKRPRSNNTDCDYDGGESHVGSSPASTSRLGGGRNGARGEYSLHGHGHGHAHQHSRSDLQLPPIGDAAVAERNAALLLLNLSVTAGGGSGGGHKSEKQTERKAGGGSFPWATVLLDKAVGGFESCQDEVPARKKRRTISI